MTKARPRRRERTAAKTPDASARWALLAVAALLTLVGCVESSGKTGVPGEQDVALFEAPTELAFGERLTVGSRFDVLVVGRRADDEARVLEGSFASNDPDVLRVIGTQLEDGESAKRQRVSVELTGAGEAFLVLRDESGTDIDRVHVMAAEAESAELLDGTLLGSVVDARLPARIGVVDGKEVPLVVAATDRCGGALLDLGGIGVEAREPSSSEEVPLQTPYLSVGVDDAGVWLIEGVLSEEDPLVPREAHLQLDGAGLAEPIVYEVKVVPASAVDEVDVAVATAAPGVASVWGRAYADDEEVIGLSYDWSSNARVTLGSSEGPVTEASISFPAEGEPADERPALVSAEVFGSEDEIDLLTLQDESELRPGRVPLSDDAPATPAGPSCGGSQEVCDPYQAGFLLGAVLLGRRLKRRKRS